MSTFIQWNNPTHATLLLSLILFPEEAILPYHNSSLLSVKNLATPVAEAIERVAFIGREINCFKNRPVQEAKILNS